MYSNIPTIDFSRFLDGSIEDRQQTVSEVDNALKTIGFLHLDNHGIEQEKVDTFFEWSKRFFNLSEHEKETLCPTPQSFGQRYFGVGKESIRGQTCMKESFDFRNPKNNSFGSWPDEKQLPGFCDFAADFYQACTELIDKLLECLSISLNLRPEESLGQHHTGSMFVSSLIHYPAVPAQLIRSGKVVRNPAHSDFGTLTLLFQRNVGGLEIADMSSTDKSSSTGVEKSGKFIYVGPKPGSILVNVGYLLMRWTNGRWKNTVHRVSEPPHPVSNKVAQETGDQEIIPERYSIAFFSFPDEVTIVEPFTSCCNDQTPKRWGPINAGQYLLKKRADLYF
ncbi:Clavaminate synthase-like protein [Periconia macrospinosa]|uniref:Clavaminate synthase-like protein n=1 Tax=Periconia macrospinosa TaxID=97972 RepID=A0A2V1CYX7_9PLEO|nr:Clavaminate synthase-like protein [Periconia macrospinosa]